MKENKTHDCGLDKLAEFSVSIGYGDAFGLPAWFRTKEDVLKFDDKGNLNEIGWWLGNGEYQSKLRYCPYCGLDLYSILSPQGK